MSSMLSSNKPSDHQSLIFSRFNKSVISELFQNVFYQPFSWKEWIAKSKSPKEVRVYS